MEGIGCIWSGSHRPSMRCVSETSSFPSPHCSFLIILRVDLNDAKHIPASVFYNSEQDWIERSIILYKKKTIIITWRIISGLYLREELSRSDILSVPGPFEDGIKSIRPAFAANSA